MGRSAKDAAEQNIEKKETKINSIAMVRRYKKYFVGYYSSFF